MVLRLFFTIIFLVSGFHLYAQTCYVGSLYLRTQQQIDNFPTQYSNCTVLRGNVEIGSFNSDITNLDSLIQIIEIQGDLEFDRTFELHNLNGLNNLQIITRELIIRYCFGLTELTGLDNLIAINEGIDIRYNPRLERVDGLNSIERIGGDVEISNNDKLTDIDLGPSLNTLNNIKINNNELLSNLTIAAPIPKIHGEIALDNNPMLIDISTFNTLDTVGSIRIENMPLIDMSGFSDLEYVTNSIRLIKNQQLVSLDGFENLRSIGVDFDMRDNYDLNNIVGLSNLETVGRQMINKDQRMLTSLAGLEKLRYVGGTMVLQNLHKLVDFEGLNNLYRVGSIVIERNLGLTGLNGLEKLNSTEGSFTLKNNYYLESINTSLTLDSIGNNFFINRNDLQNLNGFESLRHVNGELRIDAEDLTSLSGLQNLRKVGGVYIYNTDISNFEGLNMLDTVMWTFEIRSNPLLENFVGLGSLTYIGNQFRVRFNNALTNYVGLSALEEVGFYFSAQSNFNLLNFEGLTSLTKLGGLTINGNRKLESFYGMENVTQFHHAVNIYDNDVLTDIEGMANIDPQQIELPAHYGPDMTIFSNPLLSTCHIESVCGVLSIPGKDVIINSNGTNCISNEMVEMYCDECLDDITPPVAVCNDIEVMMQPTQLTSIAVNQINNNSYDFCGDLGGMYLSRYTFSCNEMGDNDVTLVVSDEHGNQGTCLSTVTIIDPMDYCCPEVYELSIDPVVFGIFSASDTLKTSSTIPGNGQVILRSGNIISLMPGFETVAGAMFEAVNEDCSN